MLLAVIFKTKNSWTAYSVLASPRVYGAFIFNLAQEGKALANMSNLQMLLCIEFTWYCWIWIFKTKESEQATDWAALGRAHWICKLVVTCRHSNNRDSILSPVTIERIGKANKTMQDIVILIVWLPVALRLLSWENWIGRRKLLLHMNSRQGRHFLHVGLQMGHFQTLIISPLKFALRFSERAG